MVVLGELDSEPLVRIAKYNKPVLPYESGTTTIFEMHKLAPAPGSE
jgi:hypothetical protein